MHDTGLTKARSMGPVVAAVQRAGGSVPRLSDTRTRRTS